MSRENRDCDQDREYLSDEELENLITQVETKAMLHAPRNLKAEVLQSAGEHSAPDMGKRRDEKHNASYQKSRRRAFFLYVLEVEAVSAAAIAMLFLTPFRNADSWTNRETRDPASSVMYQINEKSNALCSHLYGFTNRMLPSDSKK